MTLTKGTKILKTTTERWQRGLWGIDADTKTTDTYMVITRVNTKTYSVEEYFMDGKRYTGYNILRSGLEDALERGYSRSTNGAKTFTYQLAL